MDMGINKPWSNIGFFQIDFLDAFVLVTETDDISVFNSNVSLNDFTAEDICDLSVLQNKIAKFFTA